MRADLFLWALLGLAAAHAIDRRDDPEGDDVDSYGHGDGHEDGHDDEHDDGHKKPWKPKTKDPHFFNLRVDDSCDVTQGETDRGQCPYNNYAVRLEKGIAIATPYRKWWDPKLPTFFVDDDTQAYTVSKDPLQLYIDSVTGALKYTKAGWLPPSSISTSFYHTGNNPIGLVDSSPSLFTWPSTPGLAFYGEWLLCPLGETKQYQIFANNQNFDPQGVVKDYCVSYKLAAVNANPWKKQPHRKGKHNDYDDNDHSDY